MGRSLGSIYILSVVVFVLVVTCKATTYTVGDTAGWDISSDLETWQDDKRFVVGDVLSFQYSSLDTVNEVTKDNYENCYTTRFIKSYSTGNTTIALTQPGDRYFVSGNKLFCFGGMKLHIHVIYKQSMSLVGSTARSSESNNPISIVPNSANVKNHGVMVFVVIVIMSFASVFLLVV